MSRFAELDAAALPTPCFVIDEQALARNLEILDTVQKQGGARVLLALKAFATPAVADLLMATLAGTAASGLFEARLGREHFGKEVHTFSVAFRPDDFARVLELSDHVVLNSASQWRRFAAEAAAAGVEVGLRVNPRVGAAPNPLYDPCAPRSRLGAVAETLTGLDLTPLSGVHVHALCEQGLPPLETTVAALEGAFGALLARSRWLNLGGGHRITAPGYDVDGLCRLTRALAERHGVTVYLEPGEAVVYGAGVLVAEVLDIVDNDGPVAVLDASATCHTPDVIEARYRPDVLGAGAPGELGYDCRLAGGTCLAGDVFGDYSFAAPLSVGDRVTFLDQAPYTMVKTNTFNGMPLPSVAVWRRDGDLDVVKRFGYDEFARRL
ncbi:MAG TPA: carboxynorspermidine decarboxylase [Pseudomonadales bacterium]